MLGFCFRFSLKVPGSDTSCDDGDKKGFPFRCAAHQTAMPGWGCRPGVRGWLGERRCGAGWWDGGVVQTWVRKAGPRARETGTLVTCGNRPRAKNGDMRKPPTSETGAVDARDMRKPPASETGAVEHAETAREQDWRGGRS